MKKEIMIVGGGASGLFAAIFAAMGGAKVTLLEKNAKFGKKILVSGNGRCNLSNTNYHQEVFRGENPAFAWQALQAFSFSDTLAAFSKMGLYTKNKEGYLYPYSEQAQSLLDVLENKALSLKVKLKTNVEVREITKDAKDQKFKIVTQGWTYEADRIIMATGSGAFLKEDSSDSGYLLAKALGHSLIKPLPALVAVRGRDDFYGKWAKIRCPGRIFLELKEDLQEEKQEWKVFQAAVGELQLTDYGISGIPVFELSRYVARLAKEKKAMRFRIDFMPDFSEKELLSLFKMRREYLASDDLQQLLTGIFHKKLIPLFLMGCQSLEELTIRMKNFIFRIENTLSKDHAQVMSGGVATEEINPLTMESKLCKGLYFAGELIDIDGTCGGYNLQWAWTSGAIAGKNAAKEE